MRCARAIAAGPKVDSQTQPVFDDEGGDDDDDGGEAEFGKRLTPRLLDPASNVQLNHTTFLV